MIHDDSSTPGHVGLHMTQGDVNHFYEQVFFVSENGFIVSGHLGIHLYYIPELRAVDNGSALVPIWSWLVDTSRYRGTLYKTASPYPALWLQGEWATHILEFDVDKLGCFPVVVNHHVTEGLPAYYVRRSLKLRGRKVIGTVVKQRGETVFKTGVLGKPYLTRELRATLPGRWRAHQDEVKYTNLDEATGRIVVVIGTVVGRRENNIPYARRLCIADLPI